jgi:hypothetical protein
MTFGTEWDVGTTKEESKKVFDLYRSKGGNFYDTANVYTEGDSERFLGEFISGIRSEAVVATKVRNVLLLPKKKKKFIFLLFSLFLFGSFLEILPSAELPLANLLLVKERHQILVL